MGDQGYEFSVQGGSKALLLTPPGAGAIAVLRLVGPRVRMFLATHFSRPVQANRCVHGVLADGPRVLDDPVVIVSGDGTVADVNLHGGPWVVRSVLELARREGFDVVEAPSLPLPHEAVEGSAELAREILQYLPMATTELAVRALLAQETAWEALQRSPPSGEHAASILADQTLHWLLHPPRVAIVGIANVGKSTLANQLFGRERVITADVPGTTRDWIGEVANADGLAVVLVDTPGLRETADVIERDAIDRSRGQVEAADLVVLVLDPTQPREPDQAALERDYPLALRVINKSDRGHLPSVARTVRTVATTGEGIDQLRAALRAHFLGPLPLALHRPRWWTERQRQYLASLVGATGRASQPGD